MEELVLFFLLLTLLLTKKTAAVRTKSCTMLHTQKCLICPLWKAAVTEMLLITARKWHCTRMLVNSCVQFRATISRQPEMKMETYMEKEYSEACLS